MKRVFFTLALLGGLQLFTSCACAGKAQVTMTPVTLDQTYFSGILEYITEDGRISPRRMPENLMGFDKYMKSCSAGIRILLETDSPRLKLEQMFYKRDSVDFTGTTSVVVDHGVPVTFNAPAPPHEKGGDTFAFEMELPGDGLMHRVEIWLPFGRRTAITGLYLAENARVKPAAPEEKTILFLGDSITQGFFGQGIRTWASLFAHSRKANLVNLGIGGATMPPEKDIQSASDAVKRDITFLAFGVNDCSRKRPPEEFRKDAADALAILTKKGPVVVMTPLHSPLKIRQGLGESLEQFRQILREEAKRYDNVTVVEGTELLPCDDKYFGDGLHPTPEGMQYIFESLKTKVPAF